MAPARIGSAAALAWWMVLALYAASWQSTAQASRFLTAFQQSFSASSSERPQMIRAELLHRDHPDSPLAPAEGATLADRMVAAVERSLQSTASRRQLADFQTPVDLKGSYAGEYVMSISFGTPPQTFTVLVDTGSDLVWVQCVPCVGCSSFEQPGPYYDPTSSSSEKYISCTDPQCHDFSRSATCSSLGNTCQIEYGYMDGSQIQGTLTTELITIANTAGESPAATGFVMGCMNNNTGIFDNYDGIVGFSRGRYSLPSQFSTLAYLHVFAYCLVPYTATTIMSSSMLFGSSDPTNARGLVYTPLLPIGDHHYVNMTGISVGGVAVDIPASLFQYDATTEDGGVIFDSGTPITRFSTQVFGAVKLAVAAALPYPEWVPTQVNDPSIYYCFDISGVVSPVYPTVTFHYGGVDGSIVDFALAPENAFGPLWDQAGVSCLSAMAHSTADHIIGSVAQANHYIETDATVNMRLGWVTQDCTV